MKHKNLVLVVTIAIITLGVMISIFGTFGTARQNEIQTYHRNLNAVNQPVGLVDLFGQASTLADARRVAGIDFNLPTNLPAGLSLGEIRIREGVVTLVYYGGNLLKLPQFDRGTLIIQMRNDGSSYYFPRPGAEEQTIVISEGGTTRTITTTIIPSVVPNYVEFSVSGHPGWGYDPIELEWYQDSGHLEWWANGIHYSMAVALPVTSIVAIASSMRT